MTLTIAIPDGPVADFLRNEAGRRSCKPQQVAVALLACTMNGDLIEAVLDGTDPATVLPTRQSPQVKILLAMHQFRAPNGTYLISLTDMAKALDTPNRGAVRNAIQRLIAKRLLEQIEGSSPGRTGQPSRYRMTDAGVEFLAEISQC
jgi:hypothetical protein